MPRVAIEGLERSVQVPEGTKLLEALRSLDPGIEAPCGGQGRCGKCRVLIGDSGVSSVKKEVLACQYEVEKELLAVLPSRGFGRILEEGKGSHTPVRPVVRSMEVSVQRCPLGEASSDCARVKEALGGAVRIPLTVARDLPETLEACAYRGNAVLCMDTLAAIRAEKKNCCVLACDIGTTTIVSYLLDAESGEQLAVSSRWNPQAAYGADVISRCEYAKNDQEGILTSLIQKTLNELALENAGKAHVAPEDIYLAVVAGNTCMHHLFLGLSPSSLLKAPYNAAVDELQWQRASDLGLCLHPEAQVCVLPVIAGFVGGDTVGVLLSLPEDTFDEWTLVLDIGTNGELVLGKGERLFTCSTAAGPAFEGAKITCGMRGAEGAVDHVTLDQGELKISVIGGGTPAGICGSGLIDLICCLRELGILLDSGRMERPERWRPDVAARYKDRMVKRDGVRAFLLSDDPEGIYLTQKDVRQMQLAKAAIASGIELLCEEAKIESGEIRSVLLAGAFGNYLSPKSACGIGMIPSVLLDRIRSVGNAAGEGAKIAALDRDVLLRSETLARSVHFLELATSERFQEVYFQRLDF